MKIKDFIVKYGTFEKSNIVSNNDMTQILHLDFSKKAFSDYYKSYGTYLTVCVIADRDTFFDKDGTYCEQPGFSTGSFVDSKTRKSNKKDIIYIQLYDEFYELINVIINVFENNSDLNIVDK